MNIAILNEVFLQPRHLDELRSLGEVVVFERSDSEEKVIERSKGAEVVIADCWEAPLNANVFANLPDTKYMTIGSTGYDLVDVAAAKEHGVLVSNIPGFSTESVAEHVFALLFAVSRHIVTGDAAMRRGPFVLDPANTSQQVYKGIDLFGKTLGIVGMGQIGRRVAEIGNALGMNVIGYNRTPRQIEGVGSVSLDTLLETSDVVTLHMALGSDNKELVNAEALAKMKPTSYLINTARSGLVNDQDLATALRENQIAGAGLDVVNDNTANNPLLALDNVVLTPHIAFFTDSALENAADMIVANVRAYLNGSPQNIVTI
ncbi:MAG: NAD(P)-dependent oxidoreductase [Candidatus Saccharimonadales bacterium]